MLSARDINRKPQKYHRVIFNFIQRIFSGKRRDSLSDEEIFAAILCVEPNFIIGPAGRVGYCALRISGTSDWPCSRSPEGALQSYWRKVMKEGSILTRSGKIYFWDKPKMAFLNENGSLPDYKRIQSVAFGDVTTFAENLLALKHKLPWRAISIREQANEAVVKIYS